MTARRATSARRGALPQLPPRARRYVAAVVGASIACLTVTGAMTTWHLHDAVTASVLFVCGLLGVEAMRRAGSPHNGADRSYHDLLGAFMFPAIILLPPVYAGLIALGVKSVEHGRVTPLPAVKRAFNTAQAALTYCLAAVVYRAIVPAAAPGHHLRMHVLKTPDGVSAVLAAAVVALIVSPALVAGVIRQVAPATPWRTLVDSREYWILAVVEVCAGITIAMAWMVAPVLVFVAVAPIVLLQRAAVFTHLLEAARTDAKTHVATPAYWREQAQAVLVRARTSQRTAAVLVIDLDRFKAINDGHGHLVGDAVLSAVGDTLRGCSRGSDVVGRFGGEEFVAILADIDARAALATAERMRERIAAIRHVSAEDDVRVTASIGAAVLPVDGYELDELLAAADAAMYAAKRAGGNQVTLMRPMAGVPASTTTSALVPSAT